MVTREEVFRTIESLESEGIPFNVKAAEVLRLTWAERVKFECVVEALQRNLDKIAAQELDERAAFNKLLRPYGIKIETLDEFQAHTLAVARGEIKPEPDEPKLSFGSIEAMVAALKRAYNVEPH